jgi:hypothetical protein
MSHNDTSTESSLSSAAGDGMNKQQDSNKIAELTTTDDASTSTTTNLDTGLSTNDNALVWGPWQACWDQNSMAYYYWNADTNETTWTCPWVTGEYLEALPPPPPTTSFPESLPTDATINTNTDTGTGTYNWPLNAEQYPAINEDDTDIYADFMASRGDSSSGGVSGGGYVASAQFNARTGRFQADATLCPENFTISARMQRQCEAFFDYNSFAAERATGNKRPKLTKQQLERAKRRNKEKREARKRAWLNAID